MSTVGVYIGRFQPFHNGHKSVVDKMLEENDEALMILGSFGKPRNNDNPFSYSERCMLIDSAYWPNAPQLYYDSVMDNPSDVVWATSIKESVAKFCPDKDTPVRLYGAYSDASSFYLDLFPEWEKRLEELKGYHVHATTVRLWLRNRDWTHIEQNVPKGTFEYLKRLVEEEPDTCHRWLRNERESLTSN